MTLTTVATAANERRGVRDGSYLAIFSSVPSGPTLLLSPLTKEVRRRPLSKVAAVP
jgi:hypothetical protein